MAVDGTGNVFVADNLNSLVRKITPLGDVSTLAGRLSGFLDGTGTGASFNHPYGVAVDGSGNVLVADYDNHRIRKITSAGVVSTMAGMSMGYVDGTGTGASFNSPSGVVVDGSGNVFVADRNNHRIRKITPAGVVSTLAGSGNTGSTDGNGTAASFNNPFGLTIDGSGNVFVADRTNHLIRKITPAGAVSTLAGSGSSGSADGSGMAASFYYPQGVVLDDLGQLVVADYFNHRIRKITPTGVVSTLAGSSAGSADGTGTGASFYYPAGLAIDASGQIYVADLYNNRIRKITPIP
ncbi:MAG: Virginiamycin lyase [Pseudomonadota bacterium]